MKNVFNVLIFSIGSMVLFNTAAFSEPDPNRPLKVLAIGDSITSSNRYLGRVQEGSQYSAWTRRNGRKWVIANRGVPGQGSGEIAERFERELDTFAPDVVVLMAGVNDLYSGSALEPIQANLQKMYNIAEKRRLKLVTCSVLPYDTAGPPVQARLTRLNQWIRSYSRKKDFIFCDTFAVLNDPQNPFHLLYTLDGLHPAIPGYRLLDDAIRTSLETAF